MDGGDAARRGALTFDEAVPIYLAYAHGRKKPSTLLQDGLRLRLLGRSTWGTTPLRDLDHRTLMVWVADRVNAGTSVATMNRYISTGSALYRWAALAGHADENPFRRLERFSEKGRAREVYLTKTECVSVLEAAGAAFRPFLLAALATGMRRAELARLRWYEVDTARGAIVVSAQEKAGRGRVVPMTADLDAELRALKSRARDPIQGYVFLNRRGRPWLPGAIADAFREAVRLAEIDPAKRPHVTLHTCRHTAASLMIQAGASHPAVGAILGHSSPIVTKRYEHWDLEALRRSVRALSMRDDPQPQEPPADPFGGTSTSMAPDEEGAGLETGTVLASLEESRFSRPEP